MTDADHIRLEPITAQNFYKVIELKVGDGQENFVASNVKSIAESRVYPYLEPFAVYAGDEVIGFTMPGRDPENGKYYIVRLMIDARYQGKGYGKAAMQKAIEHLKSKPDCTEIHLSFVPGNPAEKLYSNLGFERTGETDESGEIIMRLSFHQ